LQFIHGSVAAVAHGGRFRVIVKPLGYVTVVLGAAALTLACMVALVQGTIRAVTLDRLPLRILAVTADLILGTILLLGCIYLSTHLAVLILGVGHAEFPSLLVDEYSRDVRSGDSAKI
jgi:hypothetical protein